MPEIIGVKQLYKNLNKISQRAAMGESFIVVKRSKPMFRVVPYRKGKNKKYTLKDLKKVQFKKLKNGKEKLSPNIDKIVYSM